MLFAQSISTGYGDSPIHAALMVAAPHVNWGENQNSEVNEVNTSPCAPSLARDPEPTLREIRAKLLELKTFSNADISNLLNDGHGCALLANYANYCAKEVCPSFYDIKPALIERSANLLSIADWHNNGEIAYICTPLGQMSFHYPGDIPTTPTFQGWEGEHLQPIAEELCELFLQKFA